MVQETWVQSQVVSYQRLQKWYLIPPCLTLSNIRYISRVKWSNPGKGVAPSPTPRCSSYWKGSLLVALDSLTLLWYYTEASPNSIWHTVMVSGIAKSINWFPNGKMFWITSTYSFKHCGLALPNNCNVVKWANLLSASCFVHNKSLYLKDYRLIDITEIIWTLELQADPFEMSDLWGMQD